MKKTFMILLTAAFLLCAFACFASAYSVDSATSLPIPTQAPDIYYVANDARDDGDIVKAYYFNSQEIVDMQREISVLGEEAFLQKYGFAIDTSEESYDYASIDYYIQFAYSFDNVNWINADDYEEENDSY